MNDSITVTREQLDRWELRNYYDRDFVNFIRFITECVMEPEAETFTIKLVK